LKPYREGKRPEKSDRIFRVSFLFITSIAPKACDISFEFRKRGKKALQADSLENCTKKKHLNAMYFAIMDG
jgi:hypothetical protein